MVIKCPNPDCKKKFNHDLRTGVQLPSGATLISCPFCGEILHNNKYEKVFRKNRQVAKKDSGEVWPKKSGIETAKIGKSRSAINRKGSEKG